MNDITPAHELLGKVVVVTDWKGLPSTCIRCPYFRSVGVYCVALGSFMDFLDCEAEYFDKRIPDCPLQIVGR